MVITLSKSKYVAGGDSQEKGIRGLFRRKIVEKTLEEKKE